MWEQWTVLPAQSMRAEASVARSAPVDASRPLADRDASQGSYMQAANSVRVFASVIGTGLPPAEGSSSAIVVSSSRRW